MTSDAKIGLLLGLIFIFIIAFVINGLPRFRNISNGSEITTNMVSAHNDTQPIGSRERQAPGVFNWTERPAEQTYQEPQPAIEQKEDVRFKIQLPDDVTVVKETSIMEVADQVEAIAPKPAEPAPPVQVPEEKVEKIVAKKPEPAKNVGPGFYVVSEGDSLGLVSVAMKCYGPELGNKKINIDRIFEANKNLLKSADEIFVGQKLIIPPLITSEKEKETEETKSTFADSIIEKVKSIGQKHLPASSNKEKQTTPYVVRQDDNLWRIATEQLGDGSRYKEIMKLNNNIIKNERDLTVGMLLRMPAQ